ncbi:MAG: glycosyl hydrolase family protein, partial [Chloroflexi bacterium]
MSGFPRGFLWGTASAAHQVEGDNKYCDWWEWEQQPGKIANGDSSLVACDNYRR